MTALSDALLAAQRRAVATLEKQYVAGGVEWEGVTEVMRGMGLTDEVDLDRLHTALAAIRLYGAQAPAEPVNGAEKPVEKATDAQVNFVQKLLNEQKQRPMAEADLRAMTKQRIHELIEALKAGRYDAAEWDVQF